jgi:hypothetical protein
MSDLPNPFEPPRSDSNPAARPPARRMVWRIYAFAVLGLQLAGLSVELPRLDSIRVLDYAATAVGLLGLFAFAFRRPLLGPWFWRPWCVFMPVWDAAMGAWIYPSQEGRFVPEQITAYFVLMVLFLPEYVALVRYAYFSPELWPLPPKPEAG